MNSPRAGAWSKTAENAAMQQSHQETMRFSYKTLSQYCQKVSTVRALSPLEKKSLPALCDCWKSWADFTLLSGNMAMLLQLVWVSSVQHHWVWRAPQKSEDLNLDAPQSKDLQVINNHPTEGALRLCSRLPPEMNTCRPCDWEVHLLGERSEWTISSFSVLYQ